MGQNSIDSAGGKRHKQSYLSLISTVKSKGPFVFRGSKQSLAPLASEQSNPNPTKQRNSGYPHLQPMLIHKDFLQ